MKKQCLSDEYLSRCGFQKGFVQEKEGKLKLPVKGGEGIFVSQTYDSGEKQTQWNRIVLDISYNAVFHAYVWLFDDRREGERADAIVDMEERFDYIKERAQYDSNYRDQLLYGHDEGMGRYAKLAVKITPEGEKDVVFKGYAMSFPKESFVAYLPVIYRNNLQLERFLAVYQNIYLELEEKIDALAKELDYECCSYKQAVRLAEWMGWGELADRVDERTLRELLREGISLAGRKGTCGYYTRLAEILWNQKAIMLEEPDRRRATVLIKGRPKDGWEACLEWMKRTAPIGVSIDFVFLHRTDRLDGQYFLDVTACLSRYESELCEGGVCIDSLKLL
ncbi:MAG: hypothetical protein K2K10_11770 [Acetatifactor sp.]|nr:hypothetical protein [Acetatifactor sp.]